MPLPTTFETPKIVIDRNGITIPVFQEVQSYLQNAFRAIYGQDIVITADSQDGQLVGIASKTIHDLYSAVSIAFLGFSPTGALGANLSRLAKLNGIERKVPSYSTVDLRIIGEVGVVIFDGVVSDGINNWLLPEQVAIPRAGEVVATARAQNLGAIAAPPNTITDIVNPQRGWQQATNLDFATPGAPLESDSELRQRQTISTSKSAETTLEATLAEIAELSGVTRYRMYENDSKISLNGIPPNSVVFVIEGGDSLQIAKTILFKKAPGAATFGTTKIDVVDEAGIPHRIRFFRPFFVPITYQIDIKRLTGYVLDTPNKIASSLADWTNALGIGNSVLASRTYVPVLLSGEPEANTYEIVQVRMARGGAIPKTENVDIAYNEVAYSRADLVTFRVLS